MDRRGAHHTLELVYIPNPINKYISKEDLFYCFVINHLFSLFLPTMKVNLKLIIGSILISQAQAIWPFDSSGSSSSLDSSPSETGSSGGTFPFDLFGSGSSLTQSSSAQASSTKSTSDSASSTDSSLFSSSNSGSSWYQTF